MIWEIIMPMWRHCHAILRSDVIAITVFSDSVNECLQDKILPNIVLARQLFLVLLLNCFVHFTALCPVSTLPDNLNVYYARIFESIFYVDFFIRISLNIVPKRPPNIMHLTQLEFKMNFGGIYYSWIHHPSALGGNYQKIPSPGRQILKT